MKVKYIGFGGYMEVPCYQDENGKIYADIDTIIKEMENIMDSFTEEEKPEWLTDADFEALKSEIKEIQEHEAENVQ